MELVIYKIQYSISLPNARPHLSTKNKNCIGESLQK